MMLAILKIIIIITTKLTEIGKVGVEGCVEVCISGVDSLHIGLNSVSKCYGEFHHSLYQHTLLMSRTWVPSLPLGHTHT